MESNGVEERMSMASPQEEKILVLVRLRPLNDKEMEANETADWECINGTTILYRNSVREGPSAYTFDRVFGGDSATRQVYDEGVKEVALSVVTGINSSIFAYGQTSSGKTYTMTGVTEYTVADIFDYIHKHGERAFVLKFSAIEIYNEAIRDLLSEDHTPLRLLDDAEKGTVVEKVTEELLRDREHLKELLSICEAQRCIGETSLNEKSSRSHQILRLTIESSAQEFIGKENSTTLSATVNFIDLAGSERASQALTSGTRLKEGCHINRSLLTLGTVIRKLSKGRHGHINYRDSKLTRLLQPALGGNARSAIICTLSPARSHAEQTRNTLLFACCAKEVSTKAQVNVVMSDKALVKHLQKEVARLEGELRSPAPASSTCDYPALLRKKDLYIQKMEKEIRELTKQRDLAESRIEDLLQMIGDDQQSGEHAGIDHHPSRQTGDIWDDECSVSESLAEPHYLCEGGKRYNVTQYDGDSGSNTEESYQGHFISDGSSSLTSTGKKIVRSSSGLSPVGDAVEAADDNCREVQYIERKETRLGEKCDPRRERDGVLALPWSGNEDASQELHCIEMKETRMGEKCDPRRERYGVLALPWSGNKDAAQEVQCTEMKETRMGGKCDPRHESDGALALTWNGNEDAAQKLQCIEMKETNMGAKCDPRHESDEVLALTWNGNEDAAHEFQCIEMKETSMGEKCDPRHESDGVLALTWSGNEDAAQEVQRIQMKETSIGEKRDPRHESDGVLALTSSGNEDAAQGASALANGNGEVTDMQNGYTYNMLEQRLDHVQKAIDTLVSPDHDPPSPRSAVAEMSSSRSMRLRHSVSCGDNLETQCPPSFHTDEQLNNNTSPNGLEKKKSSRPESLRRKFPPPKYGSTNTEALSRNDSESSLESACTDDLRSESINTPARDDIPSIHNFVAGMEQMAMQEYEKQHAESQNTESEADKFDRSLMKHVGPSESPNDWPLKFDKLRRAIVELWQTCNISLVHRTYFFLLFKGDPMDSVYMEVEHRRLSFLKDTLSQGDENPTLASSIKALYRERVMLSKLMYKRFSESDRNRLYKKMGIDVKSKQRRLQLANCLWSDTTDMNRVTESAVIVAKLVRFVQHGDALQEMFGLSFTPPSSRRKSLSGWICSSTF